VDPHPTAGRWPDLWHLQQAATVFVPVILAWFAIMALTGWLAQRQGRDDGLWAVIALILGPIALLILLVAPRTWLRRTTPDPTLATPATAPEWPGHVDGWVALTYPPPPITPSQRLLAALIGAALGGLGAALLLVVGGQPIAGLDLMVWVAAGAIVGYLLSGELIGAEGRKLVGVGIAAAALVIVVAELMVSVVAAIPDLSMAQTMRSSPAIPDLSMGAVGVDNIMLAAIGSIVLPLLYALYAQGLLVAAVAGGLIWAAVTSQVLRRGTAQPA
jgi:hypothetical protein